MSYEKNLEILLHGTELEIALLKQSDNNLMGRFRQPILFDVVADGSVDRLDFLINLGFDLHVTDYEGSTLLHGATLHGRLSMAKYLVKRGFDLRKPNNHGKTPLTYAGGLLDGGSLKRELESLETKNAAQD